MWIAELDGRATGEEEVVALARFVVAGRPPLWTGTTTRVLGASSFSLFFSFLFCAPGSFGFAGVMRFDVDFWKVLILSSKLWFVFARIKLVIGKFKFDEGIKYAQ